MKDGKPNWKRAGILFALAIVIIIGYVVFLRCMDNGRTESPSEPASSQQETVVDSESALPTESDSVTAESEPQIKEGNEDQEDGTTETDEMNVPTDDSSDTAEVPHRDSMYGISDKDVFDIGSPQTFARDKMDDDVTGNWRISTIDEDIEMVDYALSYYKKLVYNDSEVHGIVNFHDSTTTCISYMDGQLYVTVHEYVDGEEHDASLLFSGAVLDDFIVYTDNGDIEQIQ
jgi:hypothetical protein